MTDAPRLVPPPKKLTVAPEPPPPSPHHAPGHVFCWVSHDAMWISIEGNGSDVVAALRLDQAERHLEHVKTCVAQLKGKAAPPQSAAAQAAIAVEGAKP